MRTPEFIEDQKLWAGSSDLSNKNANSLNILRKDTAGAASLLVHEQDTPDLTLYVEPGNNINVNGTNLNFAGGSTPSFTVPSSGSRTDLVTLTSTGTINVYPGVSGVSNYPLTERPLAEVLLIAGDTAIVDGRVTDVRQFFGLNNSSNSRVTTSKMGNEATDYPTNTQFSLSSGSYTIGIGATEVYIDGLRKVLGTDYIEDSTTSIRLLDPVLDTQQVVIVTNQLSGFDLNGRVSKGGDTMTGTLQVPQINFGSSANKIYYSGSDLMFDDGNNTPKSLTDLTSGSGVSINHEEFVATAAQTVFDLSFSYTPGSYKLQVFVNGLLQRVGASNQYLETSSTRVTFNSGRSAGENITFHAIV